MSAILHLNNFYISSDISVSDDKKKATFFVTESVPRYNNLKIKLSVTAFDEAVAKIIRLKAKKGSSVDLICELNPYTVGGELRYSYRVIDLTYSVIPVFASSTPKEKTEEEKQFEKIKKAADILENCPFD